MGCGWMVAYLELLNMDGGPSDAVANSVLSVFASQIFVSRVIRVGG